jgi:hypothetical protein
VPQQAAPPEEFVVPPAPVAAVLPAAPIVAPPEAEPEQPEGPTPFESPELPDEPVPVPGVVPIVEGALVLEPLPIVLPEFMLPEFMLPDVPAPPDMLEVPAEVPAPALPPALCAKAALPRASERTAAEANKIRLITRPPELMIRARAISTRRVPRKPRPRAAGSA